jgi:preprotein translocase SecE subunit
MEKLEILKRFFREVRAELNKITWVGRKEVMSGTTAVLILSAFIAVFLALVDAGLSALIKLVLS